MAQALQRCLRVALTTKQSVPLSSIPAFYLIKMLRRAVDDVSTGSDSDYSK